MSPLPRIERGDMDEKPDRCCISCGHVWNRKRGGQGVICPSCHSRNVSKLTHVKGA